MAVTGIYIFGMYACHVRRKSPIVLVEIKCPLRSLEITCENVSCKLPVNIISQDSNDSHFSYLVFRFVMLRGRSLLFYIDECQCSSVVTSG